jgi:hypothetical protein
MKRTAFILAGLAAVVAIGVLVLIFSTRQKGLTTDTRSSELPNEQAKIEFLKKYLKLHSEIDATEFHIRYQDNSGIVPGPSDWDIEVVMKVPKDKLGLWTTGLQKADQADLSWGFDLLPKDERWAIHSKPAIYRQGQTVVALFEPEGIVFKRVEKH